jgi:hypothetical protein
MPGNSAYTRSLTVKLTDQGRRSLRQVVRYFEDRGYSRVQQAVIEALIRLAVDDESIQRKIGLLLPELTAHRDQDHFQESRDAK